MYFDLLGRFSPQTSLAFDKVSSKCDWIIFPPAEDIKGGTAV